MRCSPRINDDSSLLCPKSQFKKTGLFSFGFKMRRSDSMTALRPRKRKAVSEV
jgi:hypothetical protein